MSLLGGNCLNAINDFNRDILNQQGAQRNNAETKEFAIGYKPCTKAPTQRSQFIDHNACVAGRAIWWPHPSLRLLYFWTRKQHCNTFPTNAELVILLCDLAMYILDQRG